MSEHVVADADSLEPGERIVTEIEGRSIAVFNVDGEYRSYANWCPHQSGPVCQGTVTGTYEAVCTDGQQDLQWTKEDRILNCAWHGWEFDLLDGSCLSRDAVTLRSYPVTEADGEIRVTL